jgi:hypothetical protein
MNINKEKLAKVISKYLVSVSVCTINANSNARASIKHKRLLI